MHATPLQPANEPTINAQQQRTNQPLKLCPTATYRPTLEATAGLPPTVLV